MSAVKQSDMAFDVLGRIIEFPVTEDDRVEAGSALTRLDARDYQAELNRACAERNAVRADFNRYAKAFKAQAVAEQIFDLRAA